MFSADSPAKNAGIKENDIIISIDELPVTNAEFFVDAIRAVEPGEAIKLRVRRAGEEANFSAVLGNREAAIAIRDAVAKAHQEEEVNVNAVWRELIVAPNTPTFRFQTPVDQPNTNPLSPATRSLMNSYWVETPTLRVERAQIDQQVEKTQPRNENPARTNRSADKSGQISCKSN